MKRIAAIFLVLALLMGACACALTGSGYPAWDGASRPDSAFCGRFGEDMLHLEFDAGGEYSYIRDGLLTACFFAFDAGQQNYLEMYLQLPEAFAAGDVFSSADGRGDSSISFYEVSLSNEILYYAGQLIGSAYPGGSSYEIRIESAARENGCLNVSGSLSAKLCKIADSFVTDEFLELQDAIFHFSLPLQEDAQPLPSQQPSAAPEASPLPRPENTLPAKLPAYTMDPHPAFTLPPDYRVI